MVLKTDHVVICPKIKKESSQEMPKFLGTQLEDEQKKSLQQKNGNKNVKKRKNVKKCQKMSKKM